MKKVLLVLFVLAFVLTAGSAARAATVELDSEARVVFSGDVFVPEGEHAGTIVVFDGDVRIDGGVDGAIVAFNGDVVVRGSVSESVIAPSGTVRVVGGYVGDDVWASKTPVLTRDGVIDGSYGHWNPSHFAEVAGLVSRVAMWVAGSVSTLLLGVFFLLFAPRMLDRFARIGRDDTGQAIGVGILVFFGLPLVALAAFMSMVGIPLGLWILFALLGIYAVGYTTCAWLIGVSITKRDRASAFLLGWLILRAVAIVPFVAGMAWLAAAVFGLGVIGVAIWRARTPLTVEPVVPVAS